jgi:dipeptidyl aminopeptidase/acylaminoacyl peptidase
VVNGPAASGVCIHSSLHRFSHSKDLCMAVSKWVLASIGFALFLAVTSKAAPADQSGDSWVKRGLSIETESLQTTMIGGAFGLDSEIAVAPSGHAVAYTKLEPNVGDNTNRLELCLIDTRHPAVVTSVSRNNANTRLYVFFSPNLSRDGKRLAYFPHEIDTVDEVIAIRDVDAGTTRLVKLADIPKDILGPGMITTGFDSFLWSPDGSRLGVIVSSRHDRKITTGVEVAIRDIRGDIVADPNAAPRRLIALDLDSNKWAVLSPPSMDVDSFGWSPDGSRIALSASTNAENSAIPYEYTDLFLTDAHTGDTKRIVVQPGGDSNPLWSPDGQHIAFRTQKGVIRFFGGQRIGVYNVASGTVEYPAFDELGNIAGSGVSSIEWTPNSRGLLFRVPYQLSQQIFRVSLPDGKLERVSQDDQRNFGATRYSDNGSSLVFLRESFMEAPRLYESPASRFDPVPLVTGGSQGPHLPEVESRKLSWPSRDGKWTIHGWLLLPKRPHQGGRLPLFVYAEGGPMMSQPYFGVGGLHYPVHALLANGVAVLIPNSRGRAGYGIAFQTAWETERDFLHGPLEDDLAGVDALIASGVVDPERIALGGTSWGGNLAAYALTQTQLFKAILVHEAGDELDAVSIGFRVAGSPVLRDAMRQLGEGLPFDDDELARLKRLSPDYQVGHARTPALLEFGANSLLPQGLGFFQGLKYFNKAPVELINYPRSGHATEEPELRYDSARRDLEWIAYWVLGKPTARMLERYGPAPVPEWWPPVVQ